MSIRLRYGSAVSTTLPFEQAVEYVKKALASEGFGVLCEIDVAATFAKKLGTEYPPTVILGACNPTLAHRALTTEPELALLLPCNVVVTQRDGRTTVAAIDATAMLGIVGNAELDMIAKDVNARLASVLVQLAS